MIIHGYGSLNGFGAIFGYKQAEHDAWCDANMPDPSGNARCKSCSFLPWTAMAAATCGITNTASGAIDDLNYQPPQAPTGGTIFGLPKTAVYVGGGILGIGLLTMALKRKR